MCAATDLETRLSALRADYEGVTGRTWETFFCPITFCDEPVELCRGHILPEAFPDSDRAWTVQRKDVDGFYGSTIEADYLALRHKGRRSVLEGLESRRLQTELRPKFRVEGQEVAFYQPSGLVPPHHTPLVLEPERERVKLVLKMAPSDVLAAEGKKWEIGFERDLRVPVLATALKSAHLTLFHLLGYRYALSAAGHFVGADVLGTYFAENLGKSRAEAVSAAREHFAQFANMVRPLEAFPESLKGTVSDGMLYLCKTAAWPWAFQVLVRTGEFMHAVMIPCFERDHAVARYLRFLGGEEQEFAAHLTKYDGAQWNVSPEPTLFGWPDSRFDEDLSNQTGDGRSGG